MQAEVLEGYCKSVLNQLDRLEGLMTHVPDNDRPFIYNAMRDIKELRHVAKYETVKTTRQQRRHLDGICMRIDRIFRAIPKHVLEEEHNE